MSNGEEGRGCCFYGCIILIVLFLLILGAIGFGVWKVKEFAYEFTATEQRRFPEPTISPEQYTETKQKVDDFFAAVEAGQDANNIVLTDEEVNGLIWNDEKFKDLRGRVQVSFKGDNVIGEVSVPLDELPMMEGRYFNGSAILDVSCTDGFLFITPKTLEVRGKQIPEVAMKELRKQNFAQGVYEDPELMKAVQRIKKIEVKDEKLFVEISPPS